jgi:S-formylglutathione hydrolase
MSALQTVSETRCFGGRQITFEHESDACQCTMRFGVYLPPAAETTAVPAVYWLSGLTCTEENFITKAGAQRYAAELGIALIVPDTSPRGIGLPGEDDLMEIGTGAGFYLDATEAPWNKHYRMYAYVAHELVALANAELPVDANAKSISGHSMGGHGAITVGLKNADAYRSISAFAPIASTLASAWAGNALTAYLGPDREQWLAYDAAWLARNKPSQHTLLVDQGGADPFLEQLRPNDLEAACAASGQALQLRVRPGYDHGYHFVSSFIGEHLAFHGSALHA